MSEERAAAHSTTRAGRRTLVGGRRRGRRFRLAVAFTAAAAVLAGGGAVAALAATNTTLLRDDFSAGLGKWRTSGGNWWVNQSARLRQGTVTQGTARATAGSGQWTDYAVQSRVQPNKFAADGGFAGISARTTGATTFARLVLVAAGRAEVQVVRGRQVSVLASAAGHVTPGTWHTLRLEVRGKDVRGYVDGRQVPSTGYGSTAGLAVSGQVGLQTAQGTATFDNVRVTRLGGSTPSPAPSGTMPTVLPQPSSPQPEPTSVAPTTTAPTATVTPTPTMPPSNPTVSPPKPTPTASPTPSSGSNAGPVAGWNPPANLSAALDKVWAHQESTYGNGNLYAFQNYLWDQIMAAKGNINYCVRWESNATVTASQRDAIQTQLQRQFQKWMDAMTENGKGWNGWPYPKVNVKVVGWAVTNRNLLQWNDNSVDVYVGDIAEGAPQCAPPCGRFFHQDNNYGGCPGGAGHHYDMSLWLTDGFGGGTGGDWGQRIGREYYMNLLNAADVHILLHEMGHSYGLDDFYDWDPGVGGFIMKAGSAAQIAEFDKWMLRDWWRHLKAKNRYPL